MMTDQQLFGLANAVPLLGWLALGLAPLAPGRLIAAARVVAVVMAVGYAVMVGTALATGGGDLPDLTTLTGLAKAFSNPRVMLIGWVHYLAFDLWTGAWEVEEARRRGMPHWFRAALPRSDLSRWADRFGGFPRSANDVADAGVEVIGECRLSSCL